MRVLVCGGRDYDSPAAVAATLGMLLQDEGISVILHGAARGADRLAGEWAFGAGIPVEEYPADWAEHGRVAGPIRNQKMLDTQPDVVVAFPGGRGTEDMVCRARRAGVRVVVVK